MWDLYGSDAAGGTDEEVWTVIGGMVGGAKGGSWEGGGGRVVAGDHRSGLW